MVTEKQVEQTEFERCVRALLAGDAAFVFTFVDRCGPIVGSMLASRGVPLGARSRLIEEVALALLGRGPETPDTADAVAIVDAVAAAVASEPDAGASAAAPTCGSGVAARALHLVDIENLAGNPRVCGAWFDTTLRAYRAVGRVATHDLIFMAANPGLWRRTAWHVNGDIAYEHAGGVDGADLNLLSRAPAAWVAERFERLVIGSGDAIFAPLANSAADAGVIVEVVTQPDHLAVRLRHSADSVRYLPEPGGDITLEEEAA